MSRDFTSIKAPKFFTPNNDSYYDTWKPIGLSRDLHSDVTIRVFDRYGKVLADLKPFGDGWNGLYIGKKMKQDDYWYRLEYTETFSGVRRQLRGHFSLVRTK